jgi:nitrogen fixation/metabolism regulation signal transduction histidine kinase
MTTTIIDQVTSMKSLVQAFSDYANTPEVTLQPYNLNHLIRSVVEMYPSEQNQWELETSLFDIEAQVMLDKGRMRQLLHNLIKNALEAIAEQENGRIYIQTVLIDHSFQLSICDNGPGIPDKDQNWIFEPYATDKPKGTGLGLAIVRKVVDEHHGNIRMETAPEGGCCFIITLPIVY